VRHRHPRSHAKFLGLLLLCACGSTSTVIMSNNAGGSGGSGGGAAGGSGGTAGGAAVSESCSNIFVVALDRTFSAFDPRTKTFRDIGKLSCATTPATALPFSMAVARDGFAYVLYTNGELFKVSTDNLACTKTTYQPDATYRVFGMGFSTDAPGSMTDTLFIAGGPMVTSASKLGRLSVSSFMPSPGPDLVGWPELTGTGDAQLWGFFPEGSAMPFVARIDKTTGAFLTNYPAAALAGSPDSWAFAFFGGSFWIFYDRDTDTSSHVWEMKLANGMVTEALGDTGRKIVGAGVSTCVPLMIN